MRIRQLTATDFENWRQIYQKYLDFYKYSTDAKSIKITFDWLIDPSHILQGIVVEEASTLIGLAHYQIHPNPMSGKYRMFLNDLFVHEQARGSGCVDKIMKHLIEKCTEEKLESIRWLTSHDNYRARAVYDKYAKIIPFLTYSVATS